MVCFRVLAAALAAGLCLVRPAAAEWVAFTEPGHGARFAYPADIFEPVPNPDGTGDHTFESFDGQARLVIGSWDNADGESLAGMRSRLLDDARATSLTYDPSGKSWFVLSGYHGENIYYQKVMYACGGATVSAFGLDYPEAERAIYDPVVEAIEDSFRPGRNACR